MPDIKAEIIYYQTPADFELEFNLAGACKMRLLTGSAQTPKELVSSLSRAVGRNKLIMLIGKLEGDMQLCDLTAKATGMDLCSTDLTQFGATGNFSVPKGGIPLLTKEGTPAGCLLENPAQSIILLTDSSALRKAILKEYITAYIADLSEYKFEPITDLPQETQEETPLKNEPSQEEEAPAISEAIPEDAAVFPPQEGGIAVEETAAPAPAEEAKEDLSGLHNEQTFDFYTDNAFAPVQKRKTSWVKITFIVLASILAALVLVVGGAFSYYKFYMPYRAKAVYSAAQKKLGKSSSKLPDNALYKFGQLYDTNHSVAGWLGIGGTNIHYPVVSAPKNNKNYYKDHLYNKEYNLCGTPYLTQSVNDETYCRNTVIYTSGTWVGDLCGDIARYKELKFYQSAPIVTFDTLYSEGTWKVFSIFNYKDKKPVNYEQTDFFDDYAFSEYLDKLQKASLIVTPVDLAGNDSIITLVNRDANGVVSVIIARKTRPEESLLIDVSLAVLAKDYDGTPLVTSSEPVSSQEEVSSAPVQEVVSSAPAVSSAPPVSKPVKKTVTPEDDPISQNEIDKNLQELQRKIEEEKKKQQQQQAASATTPVAPDPNNGWLPLTATNKYTKEKISDTAINIISQICAGEMGSSYEPEALKAQAVAAYCWMCCNGGPTGKYPEVPMKPANEKIINAVKAVAGVVATYKGKTAQLYYCAYSAGVTANCEDIWTANLPYLKSVDSSVDKNNAGFQTLRTYRASDLAQWVKESTGIDLNTVADKNSWFHPVYAVGPGGSVSPYVKSITFGNSKTVYKGKYMRGEVINDTRVKAAKTVNADGTQTAYYSGSYVLKSGAYTIAYNKNDDTFTFTVKGYGHGVGMSQYGANQYALKGWTYRQILAHYYPGITLS